MGYEHRTRSNSIVCHSRLVYIDFEAFAAKLAVNGSRSINLRCCRTFYGAPEVPDECE